MSIRYFKHAGLYICVVDSSQKMFWSAVNREWRDVEWSIATIIQVSQRLNKKPEHLPLPIKNKSQLLATKF